MEWQWIAVGLVIAAALCYLGRETWRATRAGCGGGCACPITASGGRQPPDHLPHGPVTIIPTNELLSRLHASDRPG